MNKGYYNLRKGDHTIHIHLPVNNIPLDNLIFYFILDNIYGEDFSFLPVQLVGKSKQVAQGSWGMHGPLDSDEWKCNKKHIIKSIKFNFLKKIIQIMC